MMTGRPAVVHTTSVRGRASTFMPPAILYLKNRLAVFDTNERRLALRGAVVAAIHLVAAAIMLSTEDEAVAKLAFVFPWGLINFFWLAVLQRPAAAAALS